MATVGKTSMAITGSVTSGTKQSGGSPELPIGEDGFICYKMMGQQIKLIRALVPSLPLCLLGKQLYLCGAWSPYSRSFQFTIFKHLVDISSKATEEGGIF